MARAITREHAEALHAAYQKAEEALDLARAFIQLAPMGSSYRFAPVADVEVARSRKELAWTLIGRAQEAISTIIAWEGDAHDLDRRLGDLKTTLASETTDSGVAAPIATAAEIASAE